MNIGGDHRAVYPALLSFLHPLVLGISHKDVVDGFPRLRRNGFDRCTKGGFLEPILGKTDLAEVPIASRVQNMKGEILITSSLDRAETAILAASLDKLTAPLRGNHNPRA
jgi:hypothetical protein